MIIALNEEKCYISSIKDDVDHRKQKYFCPACGRSVLFRKGLQIIPHFAHLKKQACTVYSEPESMIHLSGKIHLYERLNQLSKNVVLEKFFLKIKQKADVYFEYQGKGYAVEFQCSQIPMEVFKKRTEGYLSIGIKPIWIFHADFVRQNGNYEIQIPKLVQLGIDSNHQIFLYDVRKKNLILFSQLTPFSKSTYFSNSTVLPLYKTTIDHFIRQILLPRKYLSKYREKRHYHLCISIRFEGLRVPFYQKLYESGYSTFTLPFFVGVPLCHGIAIRNPVIEWQGLLFLELIKHKEITQIGIYLIFKRMVQEKWIEASVNYMSLEAPEKALQEYIDLLVASGFLITKKSFYQINLDAIHLITEEKIYHYIEQLDGFHKITNN